MKRYYTIDSVAMKRAGLNYTEWTICENIHFVQAISESGYCENSRAELADHHSMKVGSFKNSITKLIGLEFLKRNSKNQLKTTQKWHDLEGHFGGHKNMTVEGSGGHKNMTVASQKYDARGHKNMTVIPIREKLERVRENKSKKENQNLPENLNLEAFKMWCDYKGKSYGEKGKSLSANKLSKYPPKTQLEMVENSIMNNYKGLFEVRKDNSKKTNNNPLDLSDANYDDVVTGERL